ncbi:hypothetical protein, partial [uncultured Desulfovibrio sp.]|uniref:hypothetical protein n=1 Tax=uncultured Desulfovibrio sp. TaxID=167968 RepID=UPI002629BD63
CCHAAFLLLIKSFFFSHEDTRCDRAWLCPRLGKNRAGMAESTRRTTARPVLRVIFSVYTRRARFSSLNHAPLFPARQKTEQRRSVSPCAIRKPRLPEKKWISC